MESKNTKNVGGPRAGGPMLGNNGACEEYEKYWCPITGEVMDDPVIAADGYTYERSAIEDWLSRSKESPITR